MKNAIIVIFGLVLLLAQGCGKNKGNDPSPLDQMKAILTSGTWNLQSVSVDGVDKTTLYSGLKVNFVALTFSSTNGHVVWPATGTWQFADETGKTINRDDGVSVAIGEASTSKLTLTLTWNKTTLGGGRSGSIKGVHVFTFVK